MSVGNKVGYDSKTAAMHIQYGSALFRMDEQSDYVFITDILDLCVFFSFTDCVLLCMCCKFIRNLC